MTTKDFYYDLPPELIAQHPLKDRAGSRLLVLDKETGKIEHKNFRNIIEYLNPGDCLVMNNTRVIPARLYGVKEDTVAEIGDLLFHLLVLMANEGIDVSDVTAELARRRQKSGNLKQFHQVDKNT